MSDGLGASRQTALPGSDPYSATNFSIELGPKGGIAEIRFTCPYCGITLEDCGGVCAACHMWDCGEQPNEDQASLDTMDSYRQGEGP